MCLKILQIDLISTLYLTTETQLGLLIESSSLGRNDPENLFSRVLRMFSFSFAAREASRCRTTYLPRWLTVKR